MDVAGFTEIQVENICTELGPDTSVVAQLDVTCFDKSWGDPALTTLRLTSKSNQAPKRINLNGQSLTKHGLTMFSETSRRDTLAGEARNFPQRQLFQLLAMAARCRISFGQSILQVSTQFSPRTPSAGVLIIPYVETAPPPPPSKKFSLSTIN